MLPAALVLPALSAVGDPQNGPALYFVICLAVAVGFAAAAGRAGSRGRATAVAGWPAVTIAGLLLEQASYPGAAAVVAALMGWGVGMFVDWRPRQRWWALTGFIGGCGMLALVRFGLGVFWAGLAVSLLALFCLGPFLRAKPRDPGRRRSAAILVGVAGGLALFSTFWVGSTSPSVEWFGQLTYHGPRDRMEVALTFDDGPNSAFTLDVARVLEEHGARGTFFLVGKAVAKEPEVAAELLARGHIAGNHSYNHGAFSYLDPTYPELMQTQRTIEQELGVCPALFRPPHGTHTPFMSHIVNDHGLHLVTWDVSAKDWVEDDPVRLARNILAKVKPGSIILLHDGIDGTPPVDRSVVVKALPAILEGLKARGLAPVTLDKLLGVPAYQDAAACK
jgi:peptidoglycan/xylan/chitin deacetylase (PgdA/CDA1 family)